MRDKGSSNVSTISIKCKEFETLVSDYIDGELSEEQFSYCEHHIGHCSYCRELVQDLESILKIAKTLRNSPIPEGVRYRLRTALRNALGINLEGPANNR